MGSFDDIVNPDGSLVDPHIARLPRRPFGTVEQMYGMIYYLAERLDNNLPGEGGVKELIEEAKQNYRQGLTSSPTPRFGSDYVLAQLREKLSAECVHHVPIQHRDAKPPWCESCGKTADGQEPVSAFESIGLRRDLHE